MGNLDLDSRRTLLLAVDRSQSVLAERAPDGTRPIAYSPYGSQQAGVQAQSHLGFNGERLERPQGWYHLGNGHRIYNPVLMRFHSPDRLSPFAEGGLNPYAYCLGDPVNYVDPTGRAASWEHVLMAVTIGMGLVLGAKALFLPKIAKMATEHEIRRLTRYFTAKPPILGSSLGGLDRINAVIGIAGAPLGFAGVGLGSNEHPSEGMQALSTALMSVSAVLGVQQILGRALVQLYPVVPKSPGLATAARWIHGKHKVEAAKGGNAVRAIAEGVTVSGPSGVARSGLTAPPSSVSTTPLPPLPEPFNRNGSYRQARRGRDREVREETRL